MSAREFRLNWQPLLAASIGLAMGSALGHYTLSLFGPALIAEFGWTKAQFALVGALPLATLPLAPFAGRFTDRFGTRVAAIVGFTAYAWLLRVAPISLVVTHQYVNPLVAIALGVLFLAERPSPLTLVGAVLIVGAVYVAVRAESPRRSSRPATAARRGTPADQTA